MTNENRSNGAEEQAGSFTNHLRGSLEAQQDKSQRLTRWLFILKRDLEQAEIQAPAWVQGETPPLHLGVLNGGGTFWHGSL